MRIAYFIQAHDAPELLRRLIAALRAPASGSLLVIGLDASRGQILREELPTGDDLVFRVRSEPVQRGELSCLEPYLDAAAWLVDEKLDFDWLVYLSGRDFPVRPVREIERDLENTAEDGLLLNWRFDSPESPWGLRRAQRRYGFRYKRLPELLRWPLKLAKPLLRLAGLELSLVYGVHLGVPARPSIFGPEFVGYGGLQWHALRRAPVEYLVEALRAQPHRAEAFRRALVPDEALVQTFLLNAGRFRFRNESRRFADTHERPGGHCRVLTLDDLSELVSGKYDFARKLDARESASLLEQLEKIVLAERPAPPPAGSSTSTRRLR